MSKKQTRETLNQMMMAFVAKGGKVTKVDSTRIKRAKYSHTSTTTTAAATGEAAVESVDMSQIPAELKAKLGL